MEEHIRLCGECLAGEQVHRRHRHRFPAHSEVCSRVQLQIYLSVLHNSCWWAWRTWSPIWNMRNGCCVGLACHLTWVVVETEPLEVLFVRGVGFQAAQGRPRVLEATLRRLCTANGNTLCEDWDAWCTPAGCGWLCSCLTGCIRICRQLGELMQHCNSPAVDAPAFPGMHAG